MKRLLEIKKINRYTTLPVLLDMLKRKRLVLLDPEKWEDRNDSAVMAAYKERNNVDKLFALCCSHGDETIHHWRTFADGVSGCCIEFSSTKLIQLLKTVPGVRYGPVKYKKLKELKQLEALKDATYPVEDMPFTKRWPYRCEEEFRIIWEGKEKDFRVFWNSHEPGNCIEIGFDLSIINKITITQRMPEAVYSTIRDHLKEVFQKPDKRISQSTLYENKIWIGKFKKA